MLCAYRNCRIKPDHEPRLEIAIFDSASRPSYTPRRAEEWLTSAPEEDFFQSEFWKHLVLTESGIEPHAAASFSFLIFMSPCAWPPTSIGGQRGNTRMKCAVCGGSKGGDVGGGGYRRRQHGSSGGGDSSSVGVCSGGGTVSCDCSS